MARALVSLRVPFPEVSVEMRVALLCYLAAVAAGFSSNVQPRLGVFVATSIIKQRSVEATPPWRPPGRARVAPRDERAPAGRQRRAPRCAAPQHRRAKSPPRRTHARAPSAPHSPLRAAEREAGGEGELSVASLQQRWWLGGWLDLGYQENEST